MRIDIRLVNNWGNSRSVTETVTLSAGDIQTIEIFFTTGWMMSEQFPRIETVNITVNGITYNIQGDGLQFFEIAFIPFILVFMIFLILAIVATQNASYTQLTTRMHNIDTRMQHSTGDADLEKLRREKAQLQQQMDSFAECLYCKSRNPRNQRKCDGCGAQVR